MCFGLQNKSYCILNKQYSPDEYYKMVDTIKSKMVEKGEYGDGMGLEFSAQAYNFSLAQISFPLSDGEITKLGGYVLEEPQTNAGEIQPLSSEEIPNTIEETKDEILSVAIRCEVTGRPFRIVEAELAFLRKFRFPLPSVHPSVRLQEYLKMMPLGKSYKIICRKCSKSIQSLFNPEDAFVTYCEKCYQQEVI